MEEHLDLGSRLPIGLRTPLDLKNAESQRIVCLNCEVVAQHVPPELRADLGPARDIRVLGFGGRGRTARRKYLARFGLTFEEIHASG